MVLGQPDRTITAADLAALATAGDRESQWRLLDVAALALPAARITSIIVVGDDGQRAPFDRAALTAPDAPVLRLNRRGALRLDRLSSNAHGPGSGEGTGADASSAIRAAVRIEVTPRR